MIANWIVAIGATMSVAASPVSGPSLFVTPAATHAAAILTEHEFATGLAGNPSQFEDWMRSSPFGGRFVLRTERVQADRGVLVTSWVESASMTRSLAEEIVRAFANISPGFALSHSSHAHYWGLVEGGEDTELKIGDEVVVIPARDFEGVAPIIATPLWAPG